MFLIIVLGLTEFKPLFSESLKVACLPCMPFIKRETCPITNDTHGWYGLKRPYHPQNHLHWKSA